MKRIKPIRKYLNKPALIGMVIGFVAAVVSLAGGGLADNDLMQRVVLFLMAAPYFLLEITFRLISVNISPSLKVIPCIFLLGYWALIGGIIGFLLSWKHSMRWPAAILLACILISFHLWAAIEFNRYAETIGETLIKTFTGQAVKWGPLAKDIINHESKKYVPLR